MAKRNRRAARRRRQRTEQPIPEGPPPETVAPEPQAAVEDIPEIEDLEMPDPEVRQALQEEMDRLDAESNGHASDPYDEQVRSTALNMSQAIYLKLVEISHIDDPTSDLAVEHYEQLADTSLAAAQIYLRRLGFMSFEGDPRLPPEPEQ